MYVVLGHLGGGSIYIYVLEGQSDTSQVLHVFVTSVFRQTVLKRDSDLEREWPFMFSSNLSLKRRHMKGIERLNSNCNHCSQLSHSFLTLEFF